MLDRRLRVVAMSFATLILSISFNTAHAVDQTGTPGTRLTVEAGITATTASLMQAQAATPPHPPHPDHELEYPDRSQLPQNQNGLAVSSYPSAGVTAQSIGTHPRSLIHTTGSSFDGATLTDTGAFPPDSMGTVGPAQFVVFSNGRIRSFTKAGVADGVMNFDPDVFFASVMTPVTGPVLLNFTSDPQARYDRFSGRWFLSIIDVPCTNATCTTTAANRWMVAVSDAASAGVISGTTVWTFFQFQADPGTSFLDYPSMGIDVNAIYVGGSIFTSAGSFVGTNGYVIQKASALGAGPLVVTMFANMAAGAGAGPESPRGADNFDPGATEGYFVGPDNAAFSAISFRRISNPGSLTPTISANILVVVPTTTLSGTQSVRLVQHAGNTGGNNGLLDTLDDRFYQVMIRNGRMWSAHNFTVTNAGVASTAAASRNAARWYEFQNLTTTPTLVQSGTVFDNAATRAAARQYWIPSVVVTGQGHAVLGATMAGTPVGATPVFVGRLAGDTLGTMVGPPTTAAVTFGTTTANYNPPSDPGGASGRRWGDYSFTVVDPLDDMTVWTIQEYNQASNSYAVRVGRLAAPPPATPTCSGSPIAFSGPTGNVVIAATSSGGSGFYDPGANLAPPALPFTHLSATVTNAIVNSVTYNTPTQVTLNITALTTGLHNVTLTNPDGQAVTATGCINAASAAGIDLTLTKSDGGASVAPGGTVAYTLTYGNAGSVSATGVVLTETVPANTTFNAGASTAGWVCAPNNNAGSTCTLAIGTVAGGASGLTATFAVTVVNPVAAGVTQISNTASIADDGTHGADPTPGNNSASDTTPVTGAPDLSVTKSDGGASVAPGGTVSYTLSYANSGNHGAAGVVLTETVPANTTFNSGASTAGWVCAPNNNAGSTCTLAIGGLPAGGGTLTATFAVTVANPVAAGVTQISNTASIADNGANGTDPTPGNNSGSDTTPLTGAPDLSVTKSDGGASVAPGGTASYTLTYANAGNRCASGVVLTETVPANATFNSGASTAGWVCAPNNNAGSTCTLAIGALAAGGGNQTATFAVTVANPVAAGVTQISNTASIADDGANGIDPTPGNNSGSDTTPLTGAPDLSVTKSDGGATVAPGGTVSYTLTYANAGNRGAAGVVLTETVPANTTFNSGASTAGWVCAPNNNAGSTCTLAIGALPAGGGNQTATFAVTVINPVGAGVTQISNTASIADDGANGTDPTPGNNSGSDTTPVTGAPDLSVTKSDGGATVAPGGTVSYTLTYANAGNRGAAGVVLTETVPANTTFNAGASTAGWVCAPNNNAGSTCTLAIGALPAGGGNQTATFAVTVANPVGAGVTQISNTASIADDGTNGTDPTPGNNSGSDTTPLTGAPDLSVTKSDGGATVAPGGTVAYTLTYANSGNHGAAGVVLTETVPANTSFNSGASTAGWVCAPNNNAGSTCTLAIGALLAGGGNQTATFAVTVASPVGAGVTQISNTATVADNGANGTDPTPANNSGSDSTPLTGGPDLSISKSDGGASAAAGATVTYTLTYANSGNRGASGVVLTETVPANSTFNSGASTAGWACVPNNNAGSTCTLAVGAVVAGGANQTAAFAVTVVTPLPAGVTQISNTASIADDGTNGTDSNPANNTSTDTTPASGAPNLTLTKSDGGASVAPGATVAYTLTYSNTGTIGSAGVTLTETVPANTTFNAGASTAGWVCAPNGNAGSTCTLAIGSVAAGAASATATFAVTVINPVPAGANQISNTASIADNGANGADSNPANNTASDTTPVTAAPNLALAKSDGGASVAPGGTVAYTLTYSNTGNIGSAGVTLTETVPANTTFNSGASSAGWTCLPNNNAGSTCTNSIGVVAAGGGTATSTFAVTVATPASAGVTQISNTATIADNGANGADSNAANNTASDTTPLTGAPDLSILVSDFGASGFAGGGIAYSLTYANGGNRGAAAVALTETVPANTTFTPSASTVGWVCAPNNNAGSTCTLAVGIVPAGAAPQTVSFVVTVVNSVPAGVTQFTDTASIADNGANGIDSNPANNTATETTPFVAGATVSATKTVAGNFFSGGNVTYTIVLQNTGVGAQADNPGNEFADVLPISLALVSATASSGTAVATVGTNTVTWNGAIPAGGSVTITITATVQTVAPGTVITNQGAIRFDSDGDGTSESTAQTDDPAVAGAANPTSFTAVSAVAIPLFQFFGLAAMAGLLAALGVALSRR